MNRDNLASALDLVERRSMQFYEIRPQAKGHLFISCHFFFFRSLSSFLKPGVQHKGQRIFAVLISVNWSAIYRKFKYRADIWSRNVYKKYCMLAPFCTDFVKVTFASAMPKYHDGGGSRYMLWFGFY